MRSQLKSGVPCVLAYARPTCCRRNKPSNLGGHKLPSPTSRLVSRSGEKQSLTQLRSVVVRAASEAQMAVDRSARFTSDFYRRPLHWVFKVGDLKKTLDFYENLLGMRVFRHEEFASGCEATCNGPYAGAWSKTMVGYGSEDTNFALELTYNYGIEGYQSGNDYRYIALRSSALKGDPASLGYEVEQCGEGKRMVAAPDGYKFMLVDDVEGGEDVEEPFLFVSTHVTDIARAKQFFTEVVGAYEYEGVPGAVGGDNSVMLGLARPASEGDVNWPCVKLELVQLEGEELDHAEASGRFATETQDGAQEAMAEQLRAAGHEGLIKHGPLRLQPHNEEVLIFTDADDNEFCFVDARCYTNCMDVAKRPGGAVVDWDYRGKLLEAALANDTLATAKLLAGDYDPQATQDSITATTSANAVVVYSQTTCPFCNKAKGLLTELGAKFEVVDLDKLEAQGHAIRAVLGESTGQTSLPHIFIKGTSIGGFTEGLEKLHNDAKLEPMLKEAGAL